MREWSASAAWQGTRSAADDLQVIDLSTDARVDASTLTFGARPILIWFWAPH